ncbi:MAG: glycosyltransferase family 1 protein [ANME-2 cluster archaeon]|nr:MAG: glycosyltransferase family 1 protein [ANME-2 cluster archaeon]
MKLSDVIEGLEGVNYKILKNSFSRKKFELIKELLTEDYDVIVDSFLSFEAMFSFTIAKLRRKPIIFWSEEWDWEKRKTFKRKLFQPIENLTISYSDAFVVPGSRHKDYFISLGASVDKIFIMPNVSNISVKDEDYKNKERLEKVLNITNKKILLYVGRLERRKGLKYLIKAFFKLRNEKNDIVLFILGRGKCRDELMLLSKSLDCNDSIYFMGYVKDELLPSYYLLCDICVVPSITCDMADPWVFIVNEAMYFGKPVIATDAVGAAFDMIKDGENGFIVPEKDSDALYNAMKKILSDPKLEKKMGYKSKSIIEEGFRYEDMVGGFKEAIEYTSR